MSDSAEDRYLPTARAAKHMTVATSTMLTWRRQHRGPKPIRLSSNRVVYDRLELDRWMRERTTFERQPMAAETPATTATGRP
jgi:predicted DNA-binding transcriptional regulator AlpA